MVAVLIVQADPITRAGLATRALRVPIRRRYVLLCDRSAMADQPLSFDRSRLGEWPDQADAISKVRGLQDGFQSNFGPDACGASPEIKQPTLNNSRVLRE
jgi:hypothetical protein